MEKLLTITELCQTFQISRPTELKYRKQGILKPRIAQGKTIRYSIDDLKSEINQER